MKKRKLILINELTQHYQLDQTFFERIEYFDLLKIEVVAEAKYISEKELNNFEKIVRLHRDLGINFEGIDVIINLLKTNKNLKSELKKAKYHISLFDIEIE